jgi:hypothetical protein
MTVRTKNFKQLPGAESPAAYLHLIHKHFGGKTSAGKSSHFFSLQKPAAIQTLEVLCPYRASVQVRLELPTLCPDGAMGSSERCLPRRRLSRQRIDVPNETYRREDSAL